MASPLLATKLNVPRLRGGLVERHRLSGRLQRGTQSRLTLISAPAGFGKTTLLVEWLAANAAVDRAVAWLSLDHTDNDLAPFWSHVIVALQTTMPGAGEAALQMLQAGQQADESMLAELLNELSALPQAVCVVLDDYHAIDHPGVQAGMTFFVEHLPPNCHLVISTRADPALPLPRLRARGELVELRLADLRFTSDEVSAYLSGTAGMDLTAKDIAILADRTEGWIAALQLAALAMQGRDDLAAFISGFAGSDRYIVDYLVEEVLQGQSEQTRSFLLHTCFLSRLSGPLCRAVTGSGVAGEMLRALDRNNLFLVPLDDRREWYRYHHLFADVLLTHFAEELRNLLPVLHRRASDWYEEHGDRAEAIRHALAGDAFDRAAELIELAIPELSRHRQEATLLGWIRALPGDLVRSRPVLGVGLVGALVSSGELDSIEGRLKDAEQGLAALAEADKGAPGSAAGPFVAVDKEQLRHLPGAIELYRTALAQVRGDVASVVGHAQRVLDLAPADDHLGRAGAAGFLGIALWMTGDLTAAYRAWSDCVAGLRRAGRIADVIGSTIALVDICQVQGRMLEACHVCESALELAGGQGGLVPRGTADIHVALADLCRERGDLDAARRHLLKAEEFGERAATPRYQYRRRVARAHLLLAEGEQEDALDLLVQAERHYVADFFPDVWPVGAMKARVWIAQGQLAAAGHWVDAAGITVDDELSYLREFDHITLARLRLAEEAHASIGRSASVALGFLDRLLQAAESGGRTASVIEILMLQALARRMHGDMEAAFVCLKRALTLAEPQGYVRLFVDQGSPMATLLKGAIKHRITPNYARELLAAFGRPEARPPTHPELIEALSGRELDVLRLLRSDMGGPEIAQELTVSLNTVRTHTRNIFEKLGVNNRRSAVRRAEELRLLHGNNR